MTRIIYTIYPVQGESLHEGDALLPMYEFPENVRLVRMRRKGEYSVCAVAEGEGAVELRRRNVVNLTVLSVSEISGWARAEELVSCDGCGELKLPIWNTGSLGVLDGRFCSRECLEAYVESK